MEKMRKKRFCAVCMLLVFVVGFIFPDTYQISAEEMNGTDLLLNPLYETVSNVNEEAAEIEKIKNNDIMLLEQKIFSTEKAAIDYLKSQMVQRKNTIVCLLDPKVYRAESFNYIFSRAIAHTEDGNGQEGDSLAFGWEAREGKILETSEYVQLTYYLTYYTSIEQERELTEAVHLAMEEMELGDKSDYEKVKTIYQYVCDNVDYDYSSGSGKLKYTPYAALCNGKAVCQGYAVLLYRFCTEADISARVIGGVANDIPHAWNIVELNEKYYNVDSTWDGETETTAYNWFLKNEVDFSAHTREDAYQTVEFHEKYPMAEESYKDNEEPKEDDDELKEDDEEPNEDDEESKEDDEEQKKDDNYIGLKNEDGIWKYYENGEWDSEKYGYVDFEESKFLVAFGKVAEEMNGLVQDPIQIEDWYYLANGQVQTQYTGLAEYDGEWFYVDKGKLDTEMSGYVSYHGSLFYIGLGRIMREVSGLAQNLDTQDWYYLAEGQVQTQYTGLAEYDGVWFYVENGVLANNHTGYVKYDGAVFYVENGIVK